MGREGVAYSFVSQEEGHELTNIEIRIDKLLKKDEMPGMELTATSVQVPEEELDPDQKKEIEEKRAVQSRLRRGRTRRRRRGLYSLRVRPPTFPLPRSNGG